MGGLLALIPSGLLAQNLIRKMDGQEKRGLTQQSLADRFVSGQRLRMSGWMKFENESLQLGFIPMAGKRFPTSHIRQGSRKARRHSRLASSSPENCSWTGSQFKDRCSL